MAFQYFRRSVTRKVKSVSSRWDELKDLEDYSYSQVLSSPVKTPEEENLRKFLCWLLLATNTCHNKPEAGKVYLGSQLEEFLFRLTSCPGLHVTGARQRELLTWRLEGQSKEGSGVQGCPPVPHPNGWKDVHHTSSYRLRLQASLDTPACGTPAGLHSGDSNCVVELPG